MVGFLDVTLCSVPNSCRCTAYILGTDFTSFDWNEILESTQGWSGAEIANFCRQVIFNALSHDKTVVTMADVRVLLDKAN